LTIPQRSQSWAEREPRAGPPLSVMSRGSRVSTGSRSHNQDSGPRQALVFIPAKGGLGFTVAPRGSPVLREFRGTTGPHSTALDPATPGRTLDPTTRVPKLALGPRIAGRRVVGTSRALPVIAGTRSSWVPRPGRRLSGLPFPASFGISGGSLSVQVVAGICHTSQASLPASQPAIAGAKSSWAPLACLRRRRHLTSAFRSSHLFCPPFPVTSAPRSSSAPPAGHHRLHSPF
jgi:hypothetical protein